MDKVDLFSAEAFAGDVFPTQAQAAHPERKDEQRRQADIAGSMFLRIMASGNEVPKAKTPNLKP